VFSRPNIYYSTFFAFSGAVFPSPHAPLLLKNYYCTTGCLYSIQ
jgi:hypothetical protein